jgi:hypothetical protein
MQLFGRFPSEADINSASHGGDIRFASAADIRVAVNANLLR